MKTMSGMELEFELKLSNDEIETHIMSELSLLDELEIDEFANLFSKNLPKENESSQDFLKRILGSQQAYIDFILFGRRLVPTLSETTLMTSADRFLSIIFLFLGKRNELKKK